MSDSDIENLSLQQEVNFKEIELADAINNRSSIMRDKLKGLLIKEGERNSKFFACYA